jgi:YHS domain-containing protein
MIRLIILLVLFAFVARAISRFAGGLIEGLRGESPSTRAPARPVPMVRDPVCGTFVMPGRAVMITEGRQQIYFCSDRCRDRYRARTA